jgi:UDP-glucose 4-epimerase
VVSAPEPAARERIVVTGGMGFIGLHTVRAVLDLGRSCVIVRHRALRQPQFIADESSERVLVKQLDVADRSTICDAAWARC